MIIAAGAGLVLEIVRIGTKGRMPISPLAVGLAWSSPPTPTFAMFLVRLFFWIMHRTYSGRRESLGHRLWIDTQVADLRGMIAGAALIGITDVLVRVFLLR